jgi:hypothetical protein
MFFSNTPFRFSNRRSEGNLIGVHALAGLESRLCGKCTNQKPTISLRFRPGGRATDGALTETVIPLVFVFSTAMIRPPSLMYSLEGTKF